MIIKQLAEYIFTISVPLQICLPDGESGSNLACKSHWAVYIMYIWQPVAPPPEPSAEEVDSTNLLLRMLDELNCSVQPRIYFTNVSLNLHIKSQSVLGYRR
jgi:hypothetical protein